ncbi:hypothetical protein EIP86_008475 [Pleurotus ostreatoroseus]|nr:hypothetical protein EIP86_008475 [Pleurotus ostreatoroseus]
MTDVPRAPSRIGFTRPPLQRQNNALRLDWTYCEDMYEDGEEWEEEYSGGLAYPSGSSNHAIDDYHEPDPPPILKPSLPSHTISLSCVPVRLLSTTATSHTESCLATCEDEPIIPDHGLSRSALNHLKEFWNIRKSEWNQREATLAHARGSASLYGVGQYARDSLRDALFGRLAAKHTPPEPAKPAADAAPPINLNTPIYPRTGDLLRLRDARFATMDRAFCNVPLYSINKMLFLHDMLDRSGASTPAPSTPSDSPVSLPKELEDSLSAEDAEAEAVFEDISLSSSNSAAACSDEDTLVEKSVELQLDVEKTQQQVLDSAVIVDDHEPERVWEVDWSARWRVLLHTTRTAASTPTSPRSFHRVLSAMDEHALLEALQSVAVSPTAPPTLIGVSKSLPSPTRTRFFIPEDDDEDDYFNSYDADEEEDYGRVLRRTVYTADADFYASYEAGLQFGGGY